MVDKILIGLAFELPNQSGKTKKDTDVRVLSIHWLIVASISSSVCWKTA